MDLDVVFLGTAGSVPTAQRGLTSALVRRGGDRILVDCGEGTQRQMMRSVGLSELDVILITHAHADHFLGLPGMLKTFNLRERERPLVVVGPPGFFEIFNTLRRIVGPLRYTLDLQEAHDGWTLAGDGYELASFATEHSVPSVGYRLAEHDRPGEFDVAAARALGVPEGPAWGTLQRGGAVTLPDGATVTPEQVLGAGRRGRSIVFSGDTRACGSVRDAAREADLLVHEATFCVDEEDRARQTGHSTARDAALTAVAADVRMLAVSHISNRYAGREVLEEARSVFAHAVCPRDFDVIEVPFAERGEPTLVPSGARPRRGSQAAAAAAASTPA